MRRLAVALAAVALVAACSDDDDPGFPAAARDDATTLPVAADDGPCAVLRPVDLRAVTGMEFDAGAPDGRSCTYTAADGVATVRVDVTDLPGDPALALETSRATCDQGSAGDLGVDGAEAAFGCTVSGVAVAGGAAAGRYAVVMGASLGDPADPGAVLADLGVLLGRVLERSDET